MTTAAAYRNEPLTAGVPARPPSVRTAVGVLVTRFPRIDETFILREINELERLGQPVVLIPLLRDHGRVVHEEAKPWINRALYMPLLSRVIVMANLRRLVRQPGRYLKVFAEVTGGTLFRPPVLLRTLALFPKSVYLADLLPRLGIQHLHAHFAVHPTTMAYIIHALSNISYSFTVHGPDVFVHRLLLREKIARAKFVRAVSTFVKAYVTGLFPAAARGKIDVVHVGVNPDVYSTAAAAANDRRRPRILSVASLTGAKGFSFLVDACAQLVEEGVDLECVIVGDGPLRQQIASRIEHHGLGDRVRMMGALPQHEVVRLVADCDIFVLPSVIAYNGQMDGIPISLMEAMAAGRPVVASAISGIPELVEHGVNGILVDATHPERIAESVRHLIENPELREQMGRAGQEKVRRNFDVRRTSAAMIALLERHPAGWPTVSQSIAALDWRDLNTCAVGLRRIRERLGSFIAELTITDGISKRDVVVKQQRAGVGDAEAGIGRARHEVEVLTRLRASMDAAIDQERGVIYSVPRVLVFDEAHAAIVMEHAAGKPLDGLIRLSRNRGMAGRLVIPMRRAGTWLRRMQEASRSGDDGRYLLTAAVLRAARDLEVAAAVDRGIRRNREEILRSLRELENRVAGRPLSIVGCHGDYRPANIFVGGQRVDVIDFEEWREGLAVEDVAWFLVTLRLYFAYPILGHGRARLEESFLDGYGDADLLDSDALRLFTMISALQRLARGDEALHPVKAWLHRRALREIVLSAIEAPAAKLHSSGVR